MTEGPVSARSTDAALRQENRRLRQKVAELSQALASAHAREAESLEQRTATSEILRLIASSPTNLQPVMDAVAENAARLCGVNDAFISLLDGELLVPWASYGPFGGVFGTPEGLRVGRGSVRGRAVMEGKTIHVHDLAAEQDDEYPESTAKQAGIRTYLATPLLREGRPIGTISIRRMEPRPFSGSQVELLKTFADQAVIAIENVRLFRGLQRSIEELRALGAISQAVSSTLDLQQVLSTIVVRAVQLSGTEGGTIYEFDASTQVFEPRANHGLSPALIEGLRGARITLGDTIVGRASGQREAVQIPDLRDEPYYRTRDLLERAGFRALLAVPLLREDAVIGALVVRRKEPGRFPRETVDLLQTFASQSVVAIENARLFREVEAKGRELEAASRHKSEFLANMSHELRTPLNAIVGFSEVLLERMFGELNDKQDEYLRDILSSGQHLLSLINDILDLSKVEAGRMELEPGTFSLPEALENGLTMLKERAVRHGILLSLEVEPDIGLVEADERKVKQVIFNLLSNAVKFTPDEGRVEVRVQRVDSGILIAVADTGIGIAPGDLGHVFDEFRQVGQPSAKAEGTGLGLALSKRFVELHCGRIWVESEVGAGSTFSFTLPQPAAKHNTGPTR
jgi:signal transduction histidine kinase